MENYTVVKKMAPALYGDVLLCKEKKSEDLVAIKRMSITLCEKKQTTKGYVVSENTQAEVYANQILNQNGGHKNVVQMRTSFIEKGIIHLVFEYCHHGELFDFLSKLPEGHPQEDQALKWFYQIARGLQYIHSKGFAHRDLSLENVLINDNEICKICDFGLVCDGAKPSNDTVGKLFYMAPEVLAGYNYDPKKADIWSLAMILFILLTGTPAVERANFDDNRFKLIHTYGIEKLITVWNLQSKISKSTMNLLSKLIRTTPSHRPSIEEILEDSCFQLYHEIHVSNNQDMIVPKQSNSIWKRIIYKTKQNIRFVENVLDKTI